MDSFEEKLNKHIDKVLEIQRNKETKPLTLQELKEVDLSLGMTEEEWDALLKKAEDQVKLAQNHLSYGNFQEAYKAADLAVSINPYHQEALLILAMASLGKYESDEKDEFLDTAHNYASELLKINPDQKQAIEILAKIRNHQKTETNQRKNFIKYGAIGLFVIIVVTVLFVFKSKQPHKENTEKKFQLIEAEEAANAAWAQVENVISRRDQLVPQLLALAPSATTANLKTDIENLNSEIKNTDNLNRKIELQTSLQEKLKELLSDLNTGNSDEKIKLILVQIEGSFNRISVEGMRYNEAAKQYNILVKKYGDEFPDFKEKPYFMGN
ncbi:MAG: LemA family protein [Bacteroidales bacterium]